VRNTDCADDEGAPEVKGKDVGARGRRDGLYPHPDVRGNLDGF